MMVLLQIKVASGDELCEQIVLSPPLSLSQSADHIRGQWILESNAMPE